MKDERDFLKDELIDLGKTLGLIEELIVLEKLSKHETVALATYLHNTYSGVERVIRALLKSRGRQIPTSETWHKDLLRHANQEGILSLFQLEACLRLLAFRHFYVHGYGHMLDEVRLREIAAPMPSLIREFLQEVKIKEGS